MDSSVFASPESVPDALRRPFASRLNRALTLPLVFLVVLSASLLLEIRSLRLALRSLDEADRVITETRALLRHAIRLESILRDYQLTGSDQFLQHYNQDDKSVAVDFPKLEQVLGDNVSRNQLSKIEQDFARWRDYAAETITRKHNGQDVTSYAWTLDGDQRMDKVREDRDRLIETEEQIRASRLQAASRTSRFAVISSVLLTFIIGGLVVFETRRRMASLAMLYQTATETAARRAEEMEGFRAIIDSSTDAIVSQTLDGRIISWNRGAERLYGYTAAEIIGQSGHVLMPSDRPDELKEILRRLAHGEPMEHFETIRRCKDGRLIEVAVTVSPILDRHGTIVGASGITRDITEHKRAEQAVYESEERFRKAFAASPDAILIASRPDGIVLEVNDSFLHITGLRRHEIVGQTLVGQGVVSEVARELGLENLNASGRLSNYEVAVRSRSGEMRTVLASAELVQVGGVECVLTIARDITARKEAERALRESEHRLQAIMDILPVGIILCDAQGKLERSNPAAAEIWGSPIPLVGIEGYSEFKGRRPGAERNFTSEEWALSRAIRNGEITTNEEIEIQTFDGRRKIILNSALPIRNGNGSIVGGLVMNFDITESKNAERALVRGEKLASVGRMAATMAHEINNPLMAAMNALYLVRTDPKLPEGLQADLRIAEQELARVSHISRQTLGFYREAGSAVPVDMVEAMESILALYAPKLRNKSIRVRTRYRVNCRVRAVAGEVQQIASNLIANSIDALPDNGVLQVRVCGPQILHGPRRMVRITIADNGHGIGVADRKRVFEPFFTTKQAVGTGLGLWVTGELVKKHEGKIRLKSVLGKGTVVSVWLPVERRAEERRAA